MKISRKSLMDILLYLVGMEYVVECYGTVYINFVNIVSRDFNTTQLLACFKQMCYVPGCSESVRRIALLCLK